MHFTALAQSQSTDTTTTTKHTDVDIHAPNTILDTKSMDTDTPQDYSILSMSHLSTTWHSHFLVPGHRSSNWM